MDSNDIVLSLYEKYLAHKSVTTDSNHVAPHAIFFALKGDNFDGNTFADQALAQGATYAVIDNTQYKKDSRYILVDNVLEILQRLAQHHRRQLNIPIIGITGSSGKTTTKELLQAVLSCRYITMATKGNLNNHIGVPLTVLAIDDQAEVAIVEMGANHVGEIAQLCEIAMPTHGLITNMGHVHIEGFGSFEGVIQGKSELYNYLHQYQGVVFVNSTDQILKKASRHLIEPVTYPQQEDFYHCQLVEESPFVVYQSENREVVSSYLLGQYHFHNIAAALCLAKYFEVNEIKANKAIQNYQPDNNRSQLVKKGSNTILLDAYNANLDSMKGAIKVLQLIPSIHKVLILGDMAELGEETEVAHQEIGHYTTQAIYKAILLCGSHMAAAKMANPDALYFPAKEGLVSFLERKKFEDTAFLIKGSRSLSLETLVGAI